MSSLEALFLLAVDGENRLLPPKAPPPCHHGLIPVDCPESEPSGAYRCPPPDQIKYRLVRIAIDSLDLYLLEAGTAINLAVSIMHKYLVRALDSYARGSRFKSSERQTFLYLGL